jgi:hypothetical protein
MTIGCLTPARAEASAAVLQSAAKSPGTSSRDCDPGHPEGDVAAMAHDLRADLISLSFKLVSDQSLIGSGGASVCRKLP